MLYQVKDEESFPALYRMAGRIQRFYHQIEKIFDLVVKVHITATISRGNWLVFILYL